MGKADAINSLVREISSEKISSEKKSRPNSYIRKDPSHGLGYFFYRSRKNKHDVVIYYWYYVTYTKGERDPKEYLGSNTTPKFPPKYKSEYFTIKESRAYKPKHSP